MSTRDRTIVRLRHPLCRATLSIRRVPIYLRFVVRGLASCSRNWDALDQLEDGPTVEEQVIAAVLVDRGSLHLDRIVNGRKVEEWHQTASYAPLDPQPPEEVLRDNPQWQAWCLSQPPESSLEQRST